MRFICVCRFRHCGRRHRRARCAPLILVAASWHRLETKGDGRPRRRPGISTGKVPGNIVKKISVISSSPCGWQTVTSPIIPQDSPPYYHASMRHLVVLFIHFLATLARLLGVRSIVVESLLLRHQPLIVNRSRHRSPNLSARDRFLAGWMALLVLPARLPLG
jgi:hypothetical protein